MRVNHVYVCAFVISCIALMHNTARADAKAEKEAACEADCQRVAETNFKSCNKIPECESYVYSEFNSCMNKCGK